MSYGFDEFGLVLCSDELDVLLESEHEFEITLAGPLACYHKSKLDIPTGKTGL